MTYFLQRARRVLFFTVVAIALATTLGAATIINTVPSWNGSASVYSFGYPNTATYGQTVTVPLTDNVLTSFAFEMDLPQATTFRGYVFAWTGTSASGSALYTSPTTNTNGAGFQLITFNTGGISLTPGGQYVLFASTSTESGSGTGSWGQTQNSNTYSGGAFVFINNGSDTTQWTTGSWAIDWLGAGGDLAFQANFNGGAVPEPATLAMVLGGLGFLFYWRRKQ